jgi:hypothetical protein
VAYCCTHRRNIFWKSNAHLKMYHHQSLELKWAAEKIAVEYKRQCKQKRSESCTFCNQDGRKHRRSRQGRPFHILTRTHTVVDKADDITSRLLQTFTFSFLHCCLMLIVAACAQTCILHIVRRLLQCFLLLCTADAAIFVVVVIFRLY